VNAPLFGWGTTLSRAACWMKKRSRVPPELFAIFASGWTGSV
jgi:hypothetical protein